MENCSLCGITINRIPHVTCDKCGITICDTCYQNNKDSCPNCGYEG